jgi:hypothetical protein
MLPCFHQPFRIDDASLYHDAYKCIHAAQGLSGHRASCQADVTFLMYRSSKPIASQGKHAVSGFTLKSTLIWVIIGAGVLTFAILDVYFNWWELTVTIILFAIAAFSMGVGVACGICGGTCH